MGDIQFLESLFEGLSLNQSLFTKALAVGMIADVTTGISKAYKADKSVSSSKLRDGGFKKAGIIFVVALSYGLSMLFTDKNLLIFNSIQAYYIYTELVSVIENLIALGVPMPPWFKAIIGKGEQGHE